MKQIILKAERVFARLDKIWVDWRGTSHQIYVEQRVPEFEAMWRSIADKVGARFRTLADDLWEIELDGAKTRIRNYQLEFDNPVTLALAGNKPLVHRLLKEGSIPVPEHIVFRLSELDKANEFLGLHPDGCVIKPADGYSGKGVTTHVLTKQEVRKAAILASLYSNELLMEPQIPGESYRLLVLEGKMVHAVCRRGLRLKGDGSSSIADLIHAENIRLKNQGMSTLDIDRDCLFTLRYQNLSLNAAPLKDQVFLVKTVNDPLRKQAEVRTVYNETATDSICSSIKRHAELAAKIVNSDFLGVDIITTDPRVPLEETDGVIDEVNTTPGLHHHYDAKVEKYPQAAVQAISVLLKRKHLRSASL